MQIYIYKRKFWCVLVSKNKFLRRTMMFKLKSILNNFMYSSRQVPHVRWTNYNFSPYLICIILLVQYIKSNKIYQKLNFLLYKLRNDQSAVRRKFPLLQIKLYLVSKFQKKNNQVWPNYSVFRKKIADFFLPKPIRIFFLSFFL